MMGSDGLLHRIAEILPQMPAVCNLRCLRGTGAGTLRVGPAAVPANDLHLAVAGESGGQGFGLASRQHVDRAPPFQIDQDRRMRVALA